MSKTKYKNMIEFQVWGDYALFSDPLTKVGGEKFSYGIPTYEAIKGVIHSIYWKPTIIWVVDSIRIMNPIKMARKGTRTLKYNGGNDLAYYTYLENVCYQVKAHFEWNDNRPELEHDRLENKHHNIAKRMIERGGRRDIFLGTRECQAYIEPCNFGEGKSAFDNTGEIQFGLTYHGITYSDEAEREEDKGQMTVRFWYPKMIDGVVEFLRPADCEIKRHIKKMPIKPFGIEYNNFVGLKELSGGDLLELD